jgi:dTDP-4-dehydrorhamnose reductase
VGRPFEEKLMSTKRTVIIGSGGRLGAALAREWSAAGEEIIALARPAIDLADLAGLRAALDALDFDVLVNCAAQTNVDRCEAERGEAFRLNAAAVEVMGEACRGKGARLVQVSTDYVFDGEKRAPYTEADPARPISAYGWTKFAGEAAAMSSTGGEALVVRVSWVFGPDRPSFVDQIIARARAEESVSAVGDKWAAPTYTLDVAELLRPFLREVRESGLLHLCNRGACTWQEYGQWALDCAAAAGVELRARTVEPLRMADLKAFIARRPVYTAMATDRLARLSGRAPRTWQEAVEAYIREHVAKRA